MTKFVVHSTWPVPSFGEGATILVTDSEHNATLVVGAKVCSPDNRSLLVTGIVFTSNRPNEHHIRVVPEDKNSYKPEPGLYTLLTDEGA